LYNENADSSNLMISSSESEIVLTGEEISQLKGTMNFEDKPKKSYG